MIYLVTGSSSLFKSDSYRIISVEKSLELLNKCEYLQYDSETTGLNPHLNKILCIQFGSDKYDFRIVVDCTTVDILYYKDILETKFLIGHNLKFDFQFLYNQSIVPRRCYDTMIVEQLLHLGYPKGVLSNSLQAVAYRRLGESIDKDIRGQIIWRGLDDDVVLYSANDVVYLERIAKSQKINLIESNLLLGAKLECNCVPMMSYLEWCGIKIDVAKWQEKMKGDNSNLDKAKKNLDLFIFNNNMTKYMKPYIIGDLFEEVDTSMPEITINWSSSKQVIKLAKELGFNTVMKDKKTGKDKDSVLEKHLKGQKGINDEFLKLYFEYQEYSKVVSSFGQSWLDAINPVTGRMHTNYSQLGTASGRMSCGGQDDNELAIYKRLPKGTVKKLNCQQLPSDHETRACFIAEEGNLFCSCDFSAIESRLGAEIYEDQAMLDEYLTGDGDIHSLAAKACFPEELEGVEIKDIKKLRPDLRKKAKAPEFNNNVDSLHGNMYVKTQITMEEKSNVVMIINLRRDY